MAANTGFPLGLLQEIERQETLKKWKNPAKGIFLNDRRERECWSCLKSGYPNLKRQTSVIWRQIQIFVTPILPPKNYVALASHGCPHGASRHQGTTTAEAGYHAAADYQSALHAVRIRAGFRPCRPAFQAAPAGWKARVRWRILRNCLFLPTVPAC